MSNFFNQFDTAPAPAAAVVSSPSANFFDRFDAAPVAAPRAAAAGQVPEYDAMGNSTGQMVDAPGASNMSYADQMRNVGGALNATVDTLSRGVPFSDRLSAAAAAATGIGGKFGDYSGNLATERQAAADALAAHPALERAGQFAGAAMLPVGVLGAAAKDASLGARALYGAAVGTGVGAAQGASSSPDFRDIGQTAKDTGLGAVEGGIVGGGLPLAGAGIGKAYQAVAPFVTRPVSGLGRVSTGILSNFTGPDAAAALDKLGPDATLADASPSLTGLAGGVASRPGAGQDDLVAALTARQAGQSDRLAADRGAALGPAVSPQALATALDKSATVQPLLDQAYNQPLPWSPDLADLAQRPAVAKALRSASDTAANAGAPLPMISLDEAGNEVSPSARAAYEAYTANAIPRTQQALADLLGHGGTLGKQDAVMAQRAAAADPLYTAFRAGSIPTDGTLSGLLQRPSIRGALPTAERLAQDEGKSIYVGGRPGELEPDPIGGGTTPDEPPGFGNAPPPDGDLASRPVPPTVPRPTSLVSFLQSAGGVRDPGGDLKSMGLDRFPGLVRVNGGLSPDMARQAAAQAGYLGADVDHAMANTTPNDLFDALDRHPAYSVHDDDAVHAWEQHDDARAAYDQQGRPQSQSAAPPRAPLSSLDPGQPAAPPRQITPEGWDYVKRALDDRISRAARRGDNNASRVYTGLKGELTGALDQASPVYAQARQASAGHSDLLDALEAGKSAVKPTTTREQVEREFAALGTEGERQMYRLGAGNSLRDLVAAKGDTADLARSIRGNLAIRSKLATLAPSPDALANFNGTLDAQSHAFDEALRPDVRGWAMARDNLRQQQANATGDQAKAIGATADAIEAHLHQIPEMLSADLTRQTAEKGQAAFDQGRKVLRGGDDQPWPADLAASFDKMPIEQQALLRAGARSDIEQRFGQNRNDLSALARLLGDQNDINRGHVQTLFGDDAAQAMADALSREQTFAGTNNRVVGNSATAGRLGGAKVIDDATKARDFVIPRMRP